MPCQQILLAKIVQLNCKGKEKNSDAKKKKGGEIDANSMVARMYIICKHHVVIETFVMGIGTNGIRQMVCAIYACEKHLAAKKVNNEKLKSEEKENKKDCDKKEKLASEEKTLMNAEVVMVQTLK